MELRDGTVVRARAWGGRFTGTAVGREGDEVVVAWHGSFVEDQVSADDVEVWPDAPAELAGWRGGVGVLSPDGGVRVQPAGAR